MEELQRLQASRRGHKAHLTKLLKKTTDIMAGTQTTDEMMLITLKTSLEQLAGKKELFRVLDNKIAAELSDVCRKNEPHSEVH